MGDVLPFRPAPVTGQVTGQVTGPITGPATAEEPLWRELVGAHLRERRHERGERLVDLAARSGVSAQYLSEVERGLKDPSSEILSAIAGALGLSVRDVARGASQRLSAAPRGPVCLAA